MIKKWESCIEKITLVGNERNVNVSERIPSAGI